MLRMGRQIDGLLTVMTPSAIADLNIVFTTRSNRILGLYPLIVPFRKEMTEKLSSASCMTACSPCILEMPYV